MKKISYLALASSLILPAFAFAVGIDKTVITPYTNGIIDIINTLLVPVIIAIAFITFLWGVYKYFILGAAEEKERAEGKTFVMWGIIGFVTILSVWALVKLGASILGLGTGGTAPTPPTFN